MSVEKDIAKLLHTAKQVDIPDWATHVAVSRIRENDAEPCFWHEAANVYIDENPNKFARHMWATCYKTYYWHFFTLAELLD